VALRKTVFERENQPPLGKYGNLRIAFLAIIGPKLLKIPWSKFTNFLLVGIN